MLSLFSVSLRNASHLVFSLLSTFASSTLFRFASPPVLFVVDRNNSAELFVRHDSIRAFLSHLISDLTYPLGGTRV